MPLRLVKDFYDGQDTEHVGGPDAEQDSTLECDTLAMLNAFSMAENCDTGLDEIFMGNPAETDLSRSISIFHRDLKALIKRHDVKVETARHNLFGADERARTCH